MRMLRRKMLKLRIIVVCNLLKPKSSCCYLLRSDDHKSEKLKNTNTHREKTTQHLQGVSGRTEERRRRGTTLDSEYSLLN